MTFINHVPAFAHSNSAGTFAIGKPSGGAYQGAAGDSAVAGASDRQERSDCY